MTRHPARFSDRFGETDAWFETDGRDITFSFRGLVFSTGKAVELTGLQLQGDPRVAAGRAAVGHEGQLVDGSIHVSLPVDAVVTGDLRAAVLDTSITFNEDPYLTRFSLTFALDEMSHGPFVGYDYETAFHGLRLALPAGIRLRVCSTCLMSSNGIDSDNVNGLNCYRSNPAEYFAARWTVDRPRPRPESVQNFHVCPLWIPGEVFAWLIPNFKSLAADGQLDEIANRFRQ